MPELIESGHRFLKSLDLEPEARTILREHLVEHRTYKTRTGREYMRTSVFADNAPVCGVLGMPMRETEGQCQ
jgi:hypothetical protein